MPLVILFTTVQSTLSAVFLVYESAEWVIMKLGIYTKIRSMDLNLVLVSSKYPLGMSVV